MKKIKFLNKGRIKLKLLVAACFMGIFSWGQDGVETVITESDYVERIPNNCQGFLIMDQNIEDVESWKVEVFDIVDGTATLIQTYHSNSGMNYIHMSPDDYETMTNRIVMSGLDAAGNVIITETHEAFIGDGPTPVLLDCEFTCEGPDYAWRVFGYEMPGTPNQSLKISRGYSTPPSTTSAGVYFFENIHSSQASYFTTEASSRGVSLAAGGPHEGVKWINLTEVQSGQTIFDKYGAPIYAGEFYYRLFKDMGDWEPDNGSSTGFATPHVGGSYCLYNIDGIMDVINADGDINLEQELACTGADFTSAGPFVSTGVYTPDLLDCLMDAPVFPDAPEWEIVDGIFLPVVMPFYLESALAFESALDDCYETSVSGGDPDFPLPTMPQIAEITVTPVDVEGDFTLTSKFMIDNAEDEDLGTELFSRPDGLYAVGFSLIDGTYILTYQEKITPDPEDVEEEFEFIISPNPVAFGTEFTVNLITEIEGTATVEIYDMATGAKVLDGTVSNDTPFSGSIRSGNRSYAVNVFTDTQSASQGLIVE